MSESAVLIGGPQDGKVIVGTRANSIEAVFMMPLAVITGTPRPRWRHPVKRLRWKPSTVPEPPKLIQLRYAADGTTDNGRRVFRLTSPWQPYRGPDCSTDVPLYEGLVQAMYAVHPVVRHDPGTRWVMDSGWYSQVRRDEHEPWSPDDVLLGTRVTVTYDGGAPHLENERFPQGWPK